MDWPRNSSDLNPITNIWKMTKINISNLYQPQTIEKLCISIQSACGNVPCNTLDELLLSMQDCINIVISQYGDPTSY
ncbi:hypothetical protein O181_087415 [Austropuccinia psidii MF-1]|uniref:Tc1-like transposase DDE domain-containing protein n=1 Tax=Austropuccinia psidii MF-1 TaxID=1389203 RepID=A0A9Q3P1V4_9BASI|nr:hypothetical protein [Austropuccinia psidii MF-1]